MPTLNPDQVTYYLDRKIWREAMSIAHKRGDAPAIVYYWWLGGDLSQVRQAKLRLMSFWTVGPALSTQYEIPTVKNPLGDSGQLHFFPQERDL